VSWIRGWICTLVLVGPTWIAPLIDWTSLIAYVDAIGGDYESQEIQALECEPKG
jgi:hypothetical protein